MPERRIPRPKGEHPIVGGHEVGIGFSGTCGAQGALLDAT
jgi:hypothetical protein